MNRILVNDFLEQNVPDIPLEGFGVGERLVEHDPQRKNIAASVDPVSFASSMVGAHVGRRRRDLGLIGLVSDLVVIH